MSIEASEPNFDRVVIVHPPWNATLASSIEERLGGWLGNKVDITTLGTESGEIEPNAELFDNSLEEGDAVALVSGDGTFNLFMRTMFSNPELQERLKGISITSMNQGGNACDIGSSLHGLFRKDPRAIFDRNRLKAVTANTLDASILQEETGQESSHLAVSYIGLGKTAEASSLLAEKKYKEANRFLRDVRLVAGTLASKSFFEVTSDRGYKGAFSDLTFANAHFMGKFGQFPTELWHPDYRITPVPKGRLATTHTAGMLLISAARGINATEPTRLVTETDAPVHFDGEPPFTIKAQSEVIVGLGETFTALTTR